MKSRLLIIFFIFTVLFFSCCSEDSSTSPEGGTFTNPIPANNSVNQEPNLTLSWDFNEEFEYFKLYLSENSNAENLYADSLIYNNCQLSNLLLDKIYYWKIVAVVEDESREFVNDANNPDQKSNCKRESEFESPIWNFQTRAPGYEDGYKLYEKLVQTELPSYVNIMFQVTNMDGFGITYLATSDFEVKEDTLSVSPTESAMNIRKKDVINYSLKTVLIIDNSASVIANLPLIKEAAVSLVENITNQQEIALYSFSENVELVQDFTSDISTLTNAINSIQPGYNSTNLYGAIIEGVNRWNDHYDIDEIEQGVLIALTDGSDTQGTSTLSEAINAIGDKKVYMVGLGNEIEPGILQQLGTSGFYNIIEVENLTENFIAIQNEITAYANSFYWLNYLSPKREGNHTLSLSIPDNYNTGEYCTINSSFNADDFYGVLAGIALNVDPDNGFPQGIDEFLITDENSYVIEAVTFCGTETPEYVWEIVDEEIAIITEDESDNSRIYISYGGNIGSTTLGVTDSANEFYKEIDIIVEYGNGLFLNPTSENPEGLSSIYLAIEDTLQLTAYTQLLRDDPVYNWIIQDASLATVTVTGDSTAIITSGSIVGESILTIEDTANNLSRDFPISINSIPVDGLLAYYPFNVNAEDESGNNNHGTAYGNALADSTYCLIGHNTSDYISLPSSLLDGRTEFTFSAQGKLDQLNYSINCLLSCAKYDWEDNEFALCYKDSDNNWYLHHQSPSYTFDQNNSVENLQWFHITLVRSNSDYSLYLNGELINTVTTNSNPLNIADGGFIIGQEQDRVGGYFESDQSFYGKIDNIRIYDRALTEGEISILSQEIHR